MVRVKLSRRGVGVFSLQFILVGKGDGMNQEIDLAPGLLQFGENIVDGRNVFDIAGQKDVGANGIGQRLHALAEGFALIGEGQFGPVLAQFTRDAPGNGMIIGDAHHQAAPALHQSICHLVNRCSVEI